MRRGLKAAALVSGLMIVGMVAGARAVQGPGAGSSAPVSSYMPVNEEDFRIVFARMRAAKAEIEKRQRERGSQIHGMAEFQEILDFPRAPRLDVFGKLDRKRATEAELRGQALFFGKAQCAACHTPPYYTDNLMHNLRAERFYRLQMVNVLMASA